MNDPNWSARAFTSLVERLAAHGAEARLPEPGESPDAYVALLFGWLLDITVKTEKASAAAYYGRVIVEDRDKIMERYGKIVSESENQIPNLQNPLHGAVYAEDDEDKPTIGYGHRVTIHPLTGLDAGMDTGLLPSGFGQDGAGKHKRGGTGFRILGIDFGKEPGYPIAYPGYFRGDGKQSPSPKSEPGAVRGSLFPEKRWVAQEDAKRGQLVVVSGLNPDGTVDVSRSPRIAGEDIAQGSRVVFDADDRVWLSWHRSKPDTDPHVKNGPGGQGLRLRGMIEDGVEYAPGELTKAQMRNREVVQVSLRFRNQEYLMKFIDWSAVDAVVVSKADTAADAAKEAPKGGAADQFNAIIANAITVAENLAKENPNASN